MNQRTGHPSAQANPYITSRQPNAGNVGRSPTAPAYTASRQPNAGGNAPATTGGVFAGANGLLTGISGILYGAQGTLTAAQKLELQAKQGVRKTEAEQNAGDYIPASFSSGLPSVSGLPPIVLYGGLAAGALLLYSLVK